MTKFEFNCLLVIKYYVKKNNYLEEITCLLLWRSVGKVEVCVVLLIINPPPFFELVYIRILAIEFYYFYLSTPTRQKMALKFRIPTGFDSSSSLSTQHKITLPTKRIHPKNARRL